MCNNIKLFKRFHELPDIVINKDNSEVDKVIYKIFIRMLYRYCKCPLEERFKEEQLNINSVV